MPALKILGGAVVVRYLRCLLPSPEDLSIGPHTCIMSTHVSVLKIEKFKYHGWPWNLKHNFSSQQENSPWRRQIQSLYAAPSLSDYTRRWAWRWPCSYSWKQIQHHHSKEPNGRGTQHHCQAHHPHQSQGNSPCKHQLRSSLLSQAVAYLRGSLERSTLLSPQKASSPSWQLNSWDYRMIPSLTHNQKLTNTTRPLLQLVEIVLQNNNDQNWSYIGNSLYQGLL